MHVRKLHPWRVSHREAVAIQEDLRRQFKTRKLPRKLRMVAGADVSYSKGSPDLFAAVVVLSLPDLEDRKKRGFSSVLSTVASASCRWIHGLEAHATA